MVFSPCPGKFVIFDDYRWGAQRREVSPLALRVNF
jgi:hypothetical protein